MIEPHPNPNEAASTTHDDHKTLSRWLWIFAYTCLAIAPVAFILFWVTGGSNYVLVVIAGVAAALTFPPRMMLIFLENKDE